MKGSYFYILGSRSLRFVLFYYQDSDHLWSLRIYFMLATYSA